MKTVWAVVDNGQGDHFIHAIFQTEVLAKEAICFLSKNHILPKYTEVEEFKICETIEEFTEEYRVGYLN